MKNDLNEVDWHEILYYDETSPSGLRWKSNRGRVKAGRVAGCIHESGYWRVSTTVNGKSRGFRCHRVVWVLCGNALSVDDTLDHIDGNILNNRIENLRVTDCRGNARNVKKTSRNRTGVTGVHELHYVVAEWVGLDGKPVRRNFSVVTYGRDEAFRLAIACRDAAIDSMNAVGAGYTDRHGT